MYFPVHKEILILLFRKALKKRNLTKLTSGIFEKYGIESKMCEWFVEINFVLKGLSLIFLYPVWMYEYIIWKLQYVCAYKIISSIWR